MIKTHKIIIWIFAIALLIATLWSAVEGTPEGIIKQKQLDTSTAEVIIIDPPKTLSVSSFDCVTPQWELQQTCTWKRPSGEQSYTCYGDDEYCSLNWIGELIPQCIKQTCNGRN